jgi:hypothetical protein
MKQTNSNNGREVLRTGSIIFLLIVTITSLFSFSISINIKTGDFLKELGITKMETDKKITNSILGGYINADGIKNAKNIVIGNRTAVVKDLLIYTKQYVNSDAFKKEYASLKESHKPTQYKVETPEEMRKTNIETYKKSVAEIEGYLKKADASMKPVFEQSLAESKKLLKDAESPTNKQVANYSKSYPDLAKSNQQSYERELQNWETLYPANQILFVKQRLQQFLIETKDIDFDAELITKNGKKIFVNSAYESKSSRWKMAFRAGKEVVEPARAFVEQWLAEIK